MAEQSSGSVDLPNSQEPVKQVPFACQNPDCNFIMTAPANKPPKFCSECGKKTEHLDQTERYPICRYCETKQLKSDPKTCVNKNCGKPFRQLTVSSSAPPGSYMPHAQDAKWKEQQYEQNQLPFNMQFPGYPHLVMRHSVGHHPQQGFFVPSIQPPYDNGHGIIRPPPINQTRQVYHQGRPSDLIRPYMYQNYEQHKTWSALPNRSVQAGMTHSQKPRIDNSNVVAHDSTVVDPPPGHPANARTANALVCPPIRYSQNDHTLVRHLGPPPLETKDKSSVREHKMKSPNSSSGNGNPPNATSGDGNPPNSNFGDGKLPSSNSGDGNPPNASFGDSNPPNSNSGDSKPPNSNYGDGKPPNSNSGDGNPPNSNSGDGNPPNSNSGDSKPPNSNSGDVNSSTAIPGDGRPPNSNSGDGRPPNSNCGDGRPPNSNSGDGRPPNSNSGDGTPPNSNSGDSNFRQAGAKLSPNDNSSADSTGIDENAPNPSTYADVLKNPKHVKDEKAGKQPNVAETRKSKNTKAQQSTYDSSADSIDKSGLEAPAERAIRITFHVIIPKLFWEWADSYSRVCIQFGHGHLGNWSDCGNFIVKREGENGYCEMACTFHGFDAAILEHDRSLPYKYVVYTPKNKGKDDCYEYLHSYSRDGADYDRCLRIPTDRLKKHIKGEYHQYDTVAYPKVTKMSKTFKETRQDKGWFKAVVDIFSKKEEVNEDELKPMVDNDLVDFCLKEYLGRLKEELLSTSSEELRINIGALVSRVRHIIYCFKRQNIYLDSTVAIEIDEWKIKEVIKNWLESIVSCLQSSPMEENGQQLVAIVFVVYCVGTFYQRYQNLKKSFVVSVLEMISLSQHYSHQESCPEYLALLTHIQPPKQRKDVSDYIGFLCNRLTAFDEETTCFTWLSALPLYHFLKGVSQPFKPIKVHPDEIPWTGDSAVGLQLIKTRAKNTKLERFSQSFGRLQRTFQIDPLVLYTFVYICPSKEFPELCKLVPPHISTAWMANCAKNLKKPNEIEVKTWITNIHYVRITYQGCADLHDIPISSVLAAFKLLIVRVFTNLANSSKNSLDVLSATIECVINSISHLVTCQGEVTSDTERFEQVPDIFEALKIELKQWIAMKEVIGGSPFGNTYKSTRIRWKGEQELKIWQTLLSFKCAVGHSVTQEWYTIVKSLVYDRINCLTAPEMKIDLFCLMESSSKSQNAVHPILEEVIMDSVTHAIDFLHDKPTSYQMKDFEQLEAFESKRVGTIFGKILVNRFPSAQSKTSINFDDLLTWHLWPKYLKIYRSGSPIKEGLPEECLLLCGCADSQLQHLCEGIKTGQITAKVMKQVQECTLQVMKLCAVSFAPSGVDTDETSDHVQLTRAEVQPLINQRLKEYECYVNACRQLLTLCRSLDSECSNKGLQIIGLQKLMSELRLDYDDLPIAELCFRDPTQTGDDHLVIHCVQLAGTLWNISSKFETVSQKYGCDLFLHTWRKNLTLAISNMKEFSIEHVESLVWTPTINHFRELLRSLVSMTIKLSDVDAHFRGQENIETQLSNLYKGVNFCTEEFSGSATAALQPAFERMNNYWLLCRYRNGAEVFHKLKEVLNLTEGDFSIMETFTSHLKESLKEQPLRYVDVKLMRAGEFLDDIAQDSRKKDCLQSFAASQELIEWIRQTAPNGVKDIQDFVTLATTTAAGGEDDFAHDSLSQLQTVGSGFAPLIYNIKSTDGYIELKLKCEVLWGALENKLKLPELLVSCNEKLNWYKSVKATQGDVETTSYGQMRNILKYGRYTVGATSRKSAQDIHDLISISLAGEEKAFHRQTYFLNELRDLESKLVLICGDNAEARAEVDHYLNLLHSATRIAELYLELLQAGNVDYSAANLVFDCAVYNVTQEDSDSEDKLFNEQIAGELVKSLQEYIKEIEIRLRKWNESVHLARSKYYELNYFTTLQLLTLRKELGVCRSESVAVVKPNVKMLLCSISPSVDDSVVQSSIQEITNDSYSDTESETSYQADDIDDQFQIHPVNHDTERDITLDQSSNEHSNDLLDEHSITTIQETEKTLDVQDLDENQRVVFDYCRDYLGYSEPHVLKALKECGPDSEQYEIEQWCEEKDDDYDDDDEEEKSEEQPANLTYSDNESDDQSSSGEDNVFLVPASKIATPSAGASPKRKPKDSPISIKLKTTNRRTINETHPIVQQLVDTEYSLEESIAAVHLHPDDLGAAMDYLDSKEDGSDEDIPREQLFERLNQSNSNNSRSDELTYEEFLDEDAGKSYLTLDQLGPVLKNIGKHKHRDHRIGKRPFDKMGYLRPGHPNLLVTPKDKVLRTVLGIYMANADSPLPTFDEVLICNPKTTAEEVALLWRRAIFDPHFERIFCLVHAERLSFQVCDAALNSLSELSQAENGYRLVIVCSKEDEENSLIISRLHLNRRQDLPDVDEHSYQAYLLKHFQAMTSRTASTASTKPLCTMASIVDPERSCVRVVLSNRSGMGKSLYIQRLSEKLKANLGCEEAVCVTVPIHGPVVNPDIVLEFLAQHMDRSECTIYHFDIAPSILAKVDTILFCLLILRGLNDSKGNVWRCHQHQLYIVEVTRPEIMQSGRYQVVELLNLLPSVFCISPYLAQTLKKDQDVSKVGMDVQLFRGTVFQRVYQYLKRQESNLDLDLFKYQDGSVNGNFEDMIALIMSKCGVEDPSWSEIHNFTKFLDIQLNACENSVFCEEIFIRDVMSGLKGFVVKFMIRMSQDFSTPSLEGVLARQNHVEAVVGKTDGDKIRQYQIAVRRQWEHCSHPYIFFNDDGESQSITFVGFMVHKNGDLIDPSNRKVLEKAIMKRELYTGLVRNKVNFHEDYRNWSKPEKIEKIAMVLGLKCNRSEIKDPDPSYVLTPDNLVKILAIQMRFRCDIPVVIMGETGCGKTRLIRYMCDLARRKQDIQNMLIMKIHGGITDKNVIEFVARAEAAAKRNREIADKKPKVTCPHTVVFFDEANTTDSIGLIKEIMCDRRCNGKPVSKDLKFIAACNPYRQHSKEMITKLETAGLGFYVRMTETQQTLGKIPLRQLVYRVLDLPPSMRPLVYDFGQLNTGTEQDYVKQIVADHAQRHPYITSTLVATVLAESQKYMREQKDECSFVSLRDVERAMIVFEYFHEHMALFAPLMDEKAKKEQALQPDPTPSHLIRALILSLSVCYHARLQNRKPYEELISKIFNLPSGAQQFRNEIRWCQEALLDNMVLGPNIAKNAALRENVFMMTICIELRIPLFLVGKPGSSKSLAKSIIQDSMRGSDSETESLLKSFKQVNVISYQCSQLSTPESVIEVFKTAEKIQARQDTKQYVSVVVLDEVGLAEDSPNLPLKALHPLLEDGTEGAGRKDEQITVERNQRVAFIGISNWALDPAKMNRGVMVTRGDPGLEELILSASGICSNVPDDPIKERLQAYFEPLSKAYMTICRSQDRQFFGLRDFYSLIKMLYWMCEKSRGRPLSWPQLEHAIKRNFGGLESAHDQLDPYNVFVKEIGYSNDSQDFSDVPEEILPVVNPDCSSQALIRTSLNTKDATWHGENRYLLFLTENYAALDVLERYLKVGAEDNSDDQITSKPFILFGSSFPKDKDYTQICRNINRIKICMETGRTVILLNLENLYESLYDVLNQYYMYSGGNRYVDLGLQTHRVKCRVHKNFKLILIAEKNTVYEKFPTPLINRLEKHFVLASSVLEKWQLEVLALFVDWVELFSHTTGNQYHGDQGPLFQKAHAFIGYQNDTPAAVVFQATNQLRDLIKVGSLSSSWKWLQKIGIFTQATFVELQHSSNDQAWKDAVLKLSKFLLMETASDAALARLKFSHLEEEEVKFLHRLYYKHQQHGCIFNFLDHHINKIDSDELFIQVTTHSRLLTYKELKTVSQDLSVLISPFDLQEFDTELDFSNKIGPTFLREDGETETRLIVIQCDSGHQNYNLIACARYRIYDESLKAKNKNRIQKRTGTTHVLFIINLPSQNVTSQFVGFQGDPWISVHIDDLRPTSDETVCPDQAVRVTISEIFLGKYDEERNDLDTFSDTSSLSEMASSLTQEHLQHRINPEGEHESASEAEEYEEKRRSSESTQGINDSYEQDSNLSSESDPESVRGSDLSESLFLLFQEKPSDESDSLDGGINIEEYEPQRETEDLVYVPLKAPVLEEQENSDDNLVDASAEHISGILPSDEENSLSNDNSVGNKVPNASDLVVKDVTSDEDEPLIEANPSFSTEAHKVELQGESSEYHDRSDVSLADHFPDILSNKPETLTLNNESSLDTYAGSPLLQHQIEESIKPQDTLSDSSVDHQLDSSHIPSLEESAENTLELAQSLPPQLSNSISHAVLEPQHSVEGQTSRTLHRDELVTDEQPTSTHKYSVESRMPKLDLYEEDEYCVLLQPFNKPINRTQKTKQFPFSPQHRRLHGCIQAAVSALKDPLPLKDRARQRISKLTKLVPSDPQDVLDYSSFYQILVNLVHSALRTKEKDRVDQKDWVGIEAMNARKLQNGGTFRNVLARRIDEVLIPIFSGIITIIDQNCNLDLIDESHLDSPLSQFWLSMLKTVRTDSVAMLSKTEVDREFNCQLPFSWIVTETIEAQWATTDTGENQREVYSQLRKSLSNTDVGEVLDCVAIEDCDQFYNFYLHDFVRAMYKSKHKDDLRDKEHKLIADSLDGMVTSLCFADEALSLTARVAALHVIYTQCRSKILWFSELVKHRPSILTPLISKCASKSPGTEMELHLLAASEVLSEIEVPLKSKDLSKNLGWWLNHVRLSQSVITSILSLDSHCDLAIKLRFTWQRIRAVQMFVEHVLLPHADVQDTVLYARRLNTRLSDPKSPPDFLKSSTLQAVKKQLITLDKKVKVDAKKKKQLRVSCRSFFMEVVSSLCFGGRVAPEPNLINDLMDTILSEDKTRDLSPYEDADETPTVRSFLLQLLLEHNAEQVKRYLDEYYTRSCRIAGPTIDQGLCLLCIQCFEDSLKKGVNQKEQIHQSVEALKEGCRSLLEHSQSGGQITLQYLEAVAKVRFALSVVADELKGKRLHGDLLQATRVCLDTVINFIDSTGGADTTEPVVYLLKLLIRQYGFPCLMAVCQTHPWIIPAELRRGEKEHQEMDPFVIYRKDYTNLRDAVNIAVYEEDMTELQEGTPEHFQTALLMLSLYQQVTISNACEHPDKRLHPKAIERLDEFILGNKHLSDDLKKTGRLLITNKQSSTLAQMTVTPQQSSENRTLCTIVVHTASVVLCCQKMDVLLPFVNMVSNPAALAKSYLPTMSEDLLQEVRSILTMVAKDERGMFYECQNGHPYLIGNCGRPTTRGNCNVCNVPIGGANYKLEANNTEVKHNDTTKTGYDLGDPSERPITQAGERLLSAPAVCIVRAIMHSAFIWASCNNPHTIEAIAQLTTQRVPAHGLSEFFWRHLERDIQDLGQFVNRGIEECAMIIHLVLRHILTTNPPIVGNSKSLTSKQARQDWERSFNEAYIEPVLRSLDTNLKKAMEFVADDDKQEHDQLFHLAYEHITVDESHLNAHLWTFRSRITVDHLRNYMRKKEEKILCAFLEAEPDLRATQYLPDIVKLQQLLFHKYHRRLDKQKAKKQNVGSFLKEMKNENGQNVYRELIDSLKKAWALVGHKLEHHNRLPIERCYLIPQITDDTPLSYLIPTTMAEGRCTTSLVDFLVLTHNNFIEKCRGIVSSGSSSAVWREHKVPITHIHRCHLLDYDQHLQSIILSHCHYSLTVGKGQDIKYDLPALEKHILNRFIYGKPTILLDIPHVAYRQDIYTAEIFRSIRQKTPQVALPPTLQQDIITELRTPDRLRETLDVVDIVLGFLSSGGGSPQVPLKKYLDIHKMKKRAFSVKAKESDCTLGHIISLWETISVELARQLWLTGQEPFEGIPENYSTKLSDYQITELDKCLRTFDLGLLLGSLFEFIEVHVKHTTAKEEDWALVEAVEVYRDMTGQKELSQLKKEFPTSIMVDQAVAAWKHIVNYQVKRD